MINKLSNEGVKLNVTALFTKSHINKVYDALNKEVPSIISIFAGRIANAGIDPEPTMIYATELAKENQVIETLWASSREVFNVIQAERCGTDIITLAPNLIAGMKDIGRDLDEYSLDTVKMFLRIPLKLVLKYKVNTKENIVKFQTSHKKNFETKRAKIFYLLYSKRKL